MGYLLIFIWNMQFYHQNFEFKEIKKYLRYRNVRPFWKVRLVVYKDIIFTIEIDFYFFLHNKKITNLQQANLLVKTNKSFTKNLKLAISLKKRLEFSYLPLTTTMSFMSFVRPIVRFNGVYLILVWLRRVCKYV